MSQDIMQPIHLLDTENIMLWFGYPVSVAVLSMADFADPLKGCDECPYEKDQDKQLKMIYVDFLTTVSSHLFSVCISNLCI